MMKFKIISEQTYNELIQSTKKLDALQTQVNEIGEKLNYLEVENNHLKSSLYIHKAQVKLFENNFQCVKRTVASLDIDRVVQKDRDDFSEGD